MVKGQFLQFPRTSLCDENHTEVCLGFENNPYHTGCFQDLSKGDLYAPTLAESLDLK